jgi:DNA mismatch repair protein MutS
MIRAGYRVAVCEQLEDPKLAKGIVKRDVVEVVTPGVQLSDKTLEANRNTYVAALVMNGTSAGIAYADISTGEFYAREIDERELGHTIGSLGVRELIVSRREAPKLELSPFYLALDQKPTITKRDEWVFQTPRSRRLPRSLN